MALLSTGSINYVYPALLLLLLHSSPGYATAFFLPSTRHYSHHNGLLYPSLNPKISSLAVYDLVIPSTASSWHSPSTGRYSSSLKAQKGLSNHQNRRQQQSRPPQQSRQQFRTVMGELDYYMKNRNHLKPYQVGAVWNRLGKAMQQSRNKREQRNFWLDNDSNLRMLVVQTMQLMDDFDGRAIATVTHSLAKLTSLTDSNLARVQSLWNALLLRTAMHLRSDSLNAHDVSNLSWAYAKVDKSQMHASLLDALANKAMLQVGDFSPQGLGNVAWAYATMKHEAPALFDAIAEAAQVRIVDFDPQALSNTAWAFATLKYEAPLVFDAIARTAQERIDDFKPQEVSNIAWAFATLSHKAPLLLDVISTTAQERIDDFTPQGLANVASAFATLNHEAPVLFDAIATAAQERIDKFDPQNLANTAWSFATLNQEAPSLFDAIARTAQERIADFNPQNLSNTAWAFATLNHEAPSLFHGIARAAQVRIADFKPQELSNTAWAFAVFNIDTDSLTDADSPFAQILLSSTEPTLSFSVADLSQLHQYHLWCRERNTLSFISDELSCRCRDAFVSQEDKTSQLQADVVASLEALQEVSQVQEEFRTSIGYSLDAVIVYRGNRIGMEVEGPSHFVGQSQLPNGKTVLKHRQLRTLEGWKLVSIPYWEWDEMCGASGGPTLESNKQAYLRSMLDGAVVV